MKQSIHYLYSRGGLIKEISTFPTIILMNQLKHLLGWQNGHG